MEVSQADIMQIGIVVKEYVDDWKKGPTQKWQILSKYQAAKRTRQKMDTNNIYISGKLKIIAKQTADRDEIISREINHGDDGSPLGSKTELIYIAKVEVN